MGHRSARVPVIATFAVLIALDCLWLGAGASAHAKTDRSPQQPHQLQPPPARLIKCAVVFDGSPCWPDPGMVRPDRRRLHVDPPLQRRPEFGPSR